MIYMTKQIYVTIVGSTLCILLWFTLAFSIFLYTKQLSYMKENKERDDIIISILKNPVSCWQLPYGIQDKIEQMSHTLSEDTTCKTNK